MMKKSRLLFVLLCSILILPAAVGQSESDMSKLLKTTLLVEWPGSEKFDKALKTAFEKYFTAIPYKFVGTKELEAAVRDESMFMFRFVTTSTGNDAMEDGYFVVLRGGEKSLKRYTTADQQMSYDFQFNGAETNSLASFYRLDFLIKAFNDELESARKLIKKKEYYGTAYRKDLNDRVKALKTKTLLFPTEIFEYKSGSARNFRGKPLKESDLSGYHYAYKVLPYAEIKAYITNPSEETKDYCIFVGRFAGSKAYEIYDINTRERLYYYFPKVAWSASLKESDYEDLSEEIGYKKKK